MYRSLLGLEVQSLDAGLWQSQLDRLTAGDVAGVVDELARTPEFLRPQGFGVRRY